jgi:hypothetical protein
MANMGSHAIWLLEHIGPVMQWREKLNRQQLQDWAYPRIVRQHYERMTGHGTLKSPPADNSALQIEIDRLKRENAKLATALSTRDVLRPWQVGKAVGKLYDGAELIEPIEPGQHDYQRLQGSRASSRRKR